MLDYQVSFGGCSVCHHLIRRWSVAPLRQSDFLPVAFNSVAKTVSLYSLFDKLTEDYDKC